MRMLFQKRAKVLLTVLVCQLPLALPAMAQTDDEREFGFSTACKSEWYIDESYAVPTAADPSVFKEFVFGYGIFDTKSTFVTEGIYRRWSTFKDRSNKFTWLRGALGAKCSRKYDPLGSTLFIRWTGYLGGRAHPIVRTACEGSPDLIPDPDVTGCGDDAAVGGGDSGGENIVSENPPPDMTVTPVGESGAPAGCQVVAVTVIIWDEDGNFFLWEGEALLCQEQTASSMPYEGHDRRSNDLDYASVGLASSLAILRTAWNSG